MEDLVLASLPRPRPIRPVDALTTAPTLETSQTSSQSDESSLETAMQRRLELPLESIERPESPLSSLGHIGLVRSQRNVFKSELRNQEEAALETKRSLSSLRKLALRLAVRISLSEAKIASHAQSLAQSRMSRYLAERASNTQPPPFSPPRTFPLSPPLSPGPNKSPPTLPRWDSSGRVSTVRFSPISQGSSLRREQSLDGINVSRASLEKELETTQGKLAKLFESQANLRDRYNAAKQKAGDLDTECQETQEKVFTLEQTKYEMEEEAQNLHQRITELEKGNIQLQEEVMQARTDRHNIYEDLNKHQSSRLTLEHQLQAATSAKDKFEIELKSLQSKLVEKIAEVDNTTEVSSATIALLEAERQKLDDELKVTKFRLSAATDLESHLQSRMATMLEREASLKQDLEASRTAIKTLGASLREAKQSLSSMDETVARLTNKLEQAEKSRAEAEEMARLAQEFKKRSEWQIRRERKSFTKTAGRLRSVRSRLLASETNKKAMESELSATQSDLEEVQEHNLELKELVKIREYETNTTVAKSTASTEQSEPSGTTTKIPTPGNSTENGEDGGNSSVEEQLVAHQKEIDSLHNTNVKLLEKLDQMTRELHDLKEAKTVLQIPKERLTSGPGVESNGFEKADDVDIASELFDLEVKQLRETKATFDKVVRSLQAKGAELELLEKWREPDNETSVLTIESDTDNNVTPELSDGKLTRPVLERTPTGGTVNVQVPTLVHGHYAESEAGIVEMPAPNLQKSPSEDSLILKNERWTPRQHDHQSNGSVGIHTRTHQRSLSGNTRPKSLDSFHSAPSTNSVYARSQPDLSISNLQKFAQSHQQSRHEKELPLRPSPSMATLLPLHLINKDLPALPRRPVGGRLPVNAIQTTKQEKRITRDDIDIGRNTWSLSPMPDPVKQQRPATSSGIPSFPSKWTATPSTLEDTKPKVQELRRAATESDLRPNQEEGRQEDQTVNSAQKRLRLMKSFSMISNKSKRPPKHRPMSSPDRPKKWSLSHLSSRLHSVKKQDSIDEVTDPSFRSSTTQTVTLTPEPVGMYDPVSKMWLIPQKSEATDAGIYDPGSEKWLAPSPRSASLRRAAHSPDSDDVKKSAIVQGEHTGEREDGALSLAEKLEMIRYDPLTWTFSKSNATPPNRSSSTSGSEIEDAIPVAPKNRAWKPGQLLGLLTPPEEQFMKDLPKNESSSISGNAATLRPSTESGSGYMSFESDYEGRRRDWKGFWRKVQMRGLLQRRGQWRKNQTESS